MRPVITSLAVAAIVALAGCGHSVPTGATGARATELRTAAATAGQFLTKSFQGRTYKLYVPTAARGGATLPLVVMLHGCTQDPDQFATGTQMNVLADQQGFLVMYPEQPSSAQSMECWNWFDPADQQRGSGEPALIAGMVGDVKSAYAVDNNAVFCAGLSAGAAMSVIMGATYPDVFAAIGVASGLEYEAATSQMNGQMAMLMGGPDPKAQGDAAYKAAGAAARLVPAIVFHGTGDHTVDPKNATQIVDQWAATDDDAAPGANISTKPSSTQTGTAKGGDGFTSYSFDDAKGQVILQEYLVDGMGHAWSGGNSAGSYTDPNGPDCSAIMWGFFKQHERTAPAAHK